MAFDYSKLESKNAELPDPRLLNVGEEAEVKIVKLTQTTKEKLKKIRGFIFSV